MCRDRGRNAFRVMSVLFACMAFCGRSHAQTNASEKGPDPFALGRAALAKSDFADAQSFFTQYLQGDPHNAEALFLEGNAELGLKNYPAAKTRYEEAIAARPDLWAAHNNLVIVYAKQGDWKDFDAERATIAAAHAAHKPGIPENSSAVIDVLDVNGTKYLVRAYDPPEGHFHTRYNFYHLGADGRPDGWISCESDDIDQVSFAKAHPQEAAAGKRSYSLDSYSAIATLPNGQRTQTHGTIKFYPDGEPTYEKVRADVVRVLEGRAAPMSSTTTTQK